MAFFRRIFTSRVAQPGEISKHLSSLNPLIKWNLLNEIGDGSFGKVHKAESKYDPFVFSAVKIIELNDYSELTTFLVEINILADCEHQFILQLYEAYLFDNKLWYFVEFCPGGALDDIIIELDHGLTENQIVCVTKQLFEAVNYLHSHRIIHRDIKAGNLLLCSQGTIRLADFGVSCISKRSSSKHDTFIGTPYWMAPEVVVCETSKDEPYSFPCDIWSSGITLIELAEMNPPYHEMNPMRVLFRIPKADPPSLFERCKWSHNFHSFLELCLNKDPSLRASSEVLLKHAFLHEYDFSPLIALYAEIRAEVIVTMQDLPEFQERLPTDDTLESSRPGYVSDNLLMDSVTDPLSDNLPEDSQLHIYNNTPNDNPSIDVTKFHISSDSVLPISKHPTSPEHKLENTQCEHYENISRVSPVEMHDKLDSAVSNITNEYKYKTLSRMRTFEVDGQVITTRTTRIIEIDKSNNLIENSQDSAHKKLKDLRRSQVLELKQLQLEEQKDCQILIEHIKQEKEIKETQQYQEKTDLDKRYAVQLERLERSRQKEFDKKSSFQQAEYKSFCKKSRLDQNKEFLRFKEDLKRNGRILMKDLKQNAKQLSKDKLKGELRNLVQDIDVRNTETIAKFEEDQLDIYEEGSIQMLGTFKNELLYIEVEFLKAKHNLIRAKEADIWEMEQSHMQINHNMVKNHLSESFLMRRHQMHIRHQKDIEHHRQFDAQRLDIMRSRHLLERRRMPKQQRVIMRKLLHDYKKKNSVTSRKDDKTKYREFEAGELRKMHCERIQLDKKLDKEMTDFKQAAECAMIELLSLQNEKKMHLTQQENDKLNEKDESFHNETQIWRNMLSERKETLEQDCGKQISKLKDSYIRRASTDITNLTVAPGTARSFRPRVRKIDELIPTTNIDD